ncbi:hypothetical protein GCM10010363_35830 [Streptomyces omiyaensis]|uniref:STAS domain-containing protein n=1 Tax=Streptomyces omiyaensis TaxID=68247 RepID=UPI001677277B|nr:STAS domain-containing protein [Streptomyces omiyaensis]GGY51642.1 hypothetical protein GCM10010363_35830 [Streptomyces omiyaensis]
MTASPESTPPAPPRRDADDARMWTRTAPAPDGTGAAILVRLGGEIDLDTAEGLETALTAALSGCHDGAGLLLDLSEVSFCDSTGLNTLLRLRLLALGRHTPLTIGAASDQVSRLLDVTGTGALFAFPPRPAAPADGPP